MIQRGMLPVSAEYREVVDRGLKHDDDGFETLDLLPAGGGDELPAIEGDTETHDRPQTTDEVDEDILALAKMDFGVATDDMGVDYSRDELLKRDMNEATRTAIVGMAKDRKAALASVEKKTSGKK